MSPDRLATTLLIMPSSNTGSAAAGAPARTTRSRVSNCGSGTMRDVEERGINYLLKLTGRPGGCGIRDSAPVVVKTQLSADDLSQPAYCLTSRDGWRAARARVTAFA